MSQKAKLISEDHRSVTCRDLWHVQERNEALGPPTKIFKQSGEGEKVKSRWHNCVKMDVGNTQRQWVFLGCINGLVLCLTALPNMWVIPRYTVKHSILLISVCDIMYPADEWECVIKLWTGAREETHRNCSDAYMVEPVVSGGVAWWDHSKRKEGGKSSYASEK